MRIALRVIDFFSEWTGRSTRWLCIALLLVLCWEVTLRYVFDAPTIWVFSLSRMLGVAIVMLGAAYTLQCNRHIRVDILYSRFSPRGKAIIDSICALIFFFPLMYILIRTSIDYMCFAWSKKEIIIWSTWYPPATPLRAVVVLGFCLLTLQGVVKFIRDAYLAIRNKTYD